MSKLDELTQAEAREGIYDLIPSGDDLDHAIALLRSQVSDTDTSEYSRGWRDAIAQLEEYAGRDKVLSTLTREAQEEGMGYTITLVAGGSIYNAVLRTLRRTRGRTWTTGEMHAEMIAQGFPMTAKRPRSTIAVIVRRLVDQGHVRVTEMGAGRVPNRFTVNQ